MNENIPSDIQHKIDELFPADKTELSNVIEEMYLVNWGVGHDQLVRSLLVLSNGSVNDFKNRMEYLEKRDAILEAENKLGNPGHFFILTFPEIENQITIYNEPC